MNSKNVNKISKNFTSQNADQALSKLLPESRDWLVSTLDPYHDYVLESRGLPDERSAPSVVQVHNQTVTLSVPASAGAGLWDASVVYSGFNSRIDLAAQDTGLVTTKGSAGRLYNSGGLSSGCPFGALNVWCGATGAVQSTGAPATVNETYACLGSILGLDRCRMIGVGIEIHNTTAEIYKQGSLTVAQLPDLACDSNCSLYIDSAESWEEFSFQADRAMVQASTLGPLLSVPGSQTWPASNGVYVVPRMTVVPRDVQTFAGTRGGGPDTKGSNTRCPVVYGTDGKTALMEPVGFNELTATGPIRVPALPARYPSGFSPTQVILSGLSNQTTLTITFRTVVEYFPALGSTLLPMASPSASFDPLALELYSKIISTCPYAVPVGDNASGDFFRKILLVIAKVLRAGSPFMGEIGPLVSFGANLAVQKLQKFEASGKNPRRRN